MQGTSIAWCDWTWNPTRGCSRISPGCMSCYAEKMIESKLLEPLSWRAKAAKFRAKHGRRPRCFVNSMSDLFHESLPHWEIARVFSVMGLCREIDFLCLTKRADRMAPLLADGEFQEDVDLFSLEIIDQIVDPNNRRSDDLRATWDHVWPLPNVWLGVSVEDQRHTDERIPHLLRTPAAVNQLTKQPREEINEMAWVMTSESLKCLLTQDEKLKLGDKVAQTVQRMRSKEDTLQEVSSQIKAEIKACQAEMNADTTKLANGYDYRTVDCRVYYHSPYKGWKRVVRLDTGEEVRVEKMGDWELQQNLFEEVQTVSTPEPPPAAGPAAENSADPNGAPPVVEDAEEILPTCPPGVEEPMMYASEMADAEGAEAPTPVVPEDYEPEPEQPAPTSRRRRS